MSSRQYLEQLAHTHVREEDPRNIRVYNPRFPINILALSVHGCLNIGNMIRSANLTGVNRFILFGNRNYDKRSAMNCFKYNRIIRVNDDFPDGIDEIEDNRQTIDQHTRTRLSDADYQFNPDLFVRLMHSQRMIPIFIEQSKDSIPLEKVNWNYQLSLITSDYEPCLIMGNESVGIPETILNTKSQFDSSFSIELSQTGIVSSYNVSNCTAIVLHDLFLYHKRRTMDHLGLL